MECCSMMQCECACGLGWIIIWHRTALMRWHQCNRISATAGNCISASRYRTDPSRISARISRHRTDAITGGGRRCTLRHVCCSVCSVCTGSRVWSLSDQRRSSFDWRTSFGWARPLYIYVYVCIHSTCKDRLMGRQWWRKRISADSSCYSNFKESIVCIDYIITEKPWHLHIPAPKASFCFDYVITVGCLLQCVTLSCSAPKESILCIDHIITVGCVLQCVCLFVVIKPHNPDFASRLGLEIKPLGVLFLPDWSISSRAA